MAGNWTNNGTAVNGFTATGNAYAVKRGTDKTTDGVTTVYVPRKSGVTCTTANDDCKAIKVYDVTKTQYLQEITADNTDLCAGKLADGLSCGVTTWGQESSMLSYANAYATANIGKVNDVTKFTTNGATPTAVDTMPDAVTNPSQITTMTWDEGEYVYNMPTNTTSCGSKPNGIEDCAVIPSANNGRAATDADPAELRSFVDVSQNFTASKDPDFTAKDTFIGKRSDGTEVVCGKVVGHAVAPVYYDDKSDWVVAAGTAGNKDGAKGADFYKPTAKNPNVTAEAADYKVGGACAQYDAHYLIGNYYQWNAATVSSGGNIINTEAVSSICPAGWTLPLSGESNNAKSGSFYNLLAKYGLTTSLDGNGIDGLSYNISLAPLWYIRIGYSTPYYGDLRGSGLSSYIWSRPARSAVTNAYLQNFNATAMYPSDNSDRWASLPLRCLHRL